MDTSIKVSEYQARRKKINAALKDSIGLVFAGDGAPPLRGEWFPDMNFRYLTGIANEPGAVVLFDPTNPNPKRRTILFLKPVNPEMDVWDGYRDHISQELRDRYGFETVMRTLSLPRFLTDAARRTKKLACLHPTAAYTQPLTHDLDIFQKVAARMPGCAIIDKSDTIISQRLVKSTAEIKQITTAIKATHNGLNRLLAKLKPGVGERELHNALVGGFAEAGSIRNAFDPIVGSGHNATVLHYKENAGVCNDGELVVVDSGAEINGYASDITRTFPVSGKFTKEQAKLYNIVLKSQQEAIKAVKPGATMAQVDEASRKVIRDAGYGDQYMHGVGHHLGLETHDPSPEVKLKPGMVVTIEPGIYLQDQSIGIRIEDDILVTESGNRNLSSMIPKTVAEVEAAIKQAK
ncbi:MAG: aminopeptidase P family protein [Phycisphaerales bacterium]|nr:aminopeptidase P family protein [Phycisphaerales bacterium]